MKIKHGTKIEGRSFYPKDQKSTLTVVGGRSVSVCIRVPYYVGRAFSVQSNRWGEGILILLPGVILDDVKS